MSISDNGMFGRQLKSICCWNVSIVDKLFELYRLFRLFSSWLPLVSHEYVERTGYVQVYKLVWLQFRSDRCDQLPKLPTLGVCFVHELLRMQQKYALQMVWQHLFTNNFIVHRWPADSNIIVPCANYYEYNSAGCWHDGVNTIDPTDTTTNTESNTSHKSLRVHQRSSWLFLLVRWSTSMCDLVFWQQYVSK